MATDATELLDFATSLPEGGEKSSVADSVAFCFRGRAIGFVSRDGTTLYVKATLDERDAMVRSDPETFAEWYTSGSYGWVTVRLDRVEPDEARELVVEAWRLTAPQRLVREYDASHPV